MHSLRAANAGLLRLSARITPTEQQRMLFLTLVAGGVCGLVAVSFHLSIQWLERNLGERAGQLGGTSWGVATVVLPACGALVAGAIATRLPAVRGSGIPQVKAVYAVSSGRQRLRMRDAVGKFALASLTIGTGSSLGREGPTVQICATVASAIGRLFALSPSNQRRLIPVGAAAGVAAAFNAPIAAVTFVIEELVGALDTTVLSGVVVAAALAAVVEHSILGEHTIFEVPHAYGLTHASSLLIFGALGLAAGLSAHAFVRGLLSTRKAFSSLRVVPGFAKPAIGALATGCIALLVATMLGAGGIPGGGYKTIGLALGGQLAIPMLLSLFAAKAIATLLGYSSGGVGGIFAPTLFVGSMLGGLFGYLDAFVLSHPDTQIGAFALVGMGAFFAGVIRAPITSVLIIFEMTGSYRLVLPLMITNTVAFLVARRLAKLPIYEALLDQDGVRLPSGKGTTPALSMLTVRDALTRDVVTLGTTDSVDGAIHKASETTHSSFPVLAVDRTLRGVITEGRLRRISAEGGGGSSLHDHASVREFLHTGQSLREALSAMNRLGLRQMVVVEEQDRNQLAGILAMSDVMRAVLAEEASPDSRATLTPMPHLPAKRS